MRRLVNTVGSIGLMTALWGCSGSDDSATSLGSDGGSAGAAAAGASGAGGSGVSSGGSSSSAGASAAGSAGAVSSNAGAGGATTGGAAGATSAGSAGDSGGTAGTGGGAGGTAGTGGVAGDASAGTGDASAGSGGASAGSGGSAGASTAAVPAAVSGVTIDTTTSEFAVDVTWTDTANDETGFNVYFSTNDTQPDTPTASISAGSTEYKLTQVQGGQTYRVWVEAVNGAGSSTATEAVAASATTDLIWDDLWLDDSGIIHLAIEDTLGFLTDNDDTTGLYAYQSASLTNMGSAQAIDPTLLINVASASIDITVPQYFWTEARTANGSLFSLRTLAPAGAVTNLAAVPSTSSVALSWDATPDANGYAVFSGTGDLSTATQANDATTNAAAVNGLNPTTQYSFWVYATSPGIGGNGFPGPFATVQATTTQ